MHAEAYDYVARVAGEHGPFDRIIECGSIDVNGTVRDLFDGADYTGVDLLDGPGVDVVGDFADHAPGELVDLVLCLEVLEHTPDHDGIISKARQVLAPGGLLIVTCAIDPRTPHGVAGGPVGDEFYANVDPDQLQATLTEHGFSDQRIEAHENRGDLYVTAWPDA